MDDLEKTLADTKLVIFDFDGTVGRVKVDWPSCRVELRKYLQDKFQLAISDNTRVDEMEYLVFEKLGQEALADILKFRRRYEEAYSGVAPNADLIKAITTSKTQNNNFTIWSNNLKVTVQRAVQDLGLDGFFSYIVGLDNTLSPKPNPEGGLEILSQYVILPEEVLMIGDNPNIDGAAAKNLGVDYLNVQMPK